MIKREFFFCKYFRLKWHHITFTYYILMIFCKINFSNIRKRKNPATSRSRPDSSPCLLGHVQLVLSCELIQMCVQHGLRLVSRGRSQCGRGLLPEGHGCWRRCHTADRWSWHTFFLFLQLILHSLVQVRLHGQRVSPTITVVATGQETTRRGTENESKSEVKGEKIKSEHL